MKKKLMAVALATIIVVMAVAGSSLAWLKATTTPVTNTFTEGKVDITLDEVKVDEYGVPVTPAERVNSNEYKLIPGYTYTKDPTVHVIADSEACYVYVKVENNLLGIIDDTSPAISIENQIIGEGWALLGGTTNVYWKSVDAADAKTGTDLIVFKNFTIKGETSNEMIKDYSAYTIVVTAYAVQKHSFDNAKAAWDANFGS